MLKAVAARLTATVRTTDTVARIGGDEFVVILHETGTRLSVVDVTRRILDVIRRAGRVRGHRGHVRASIGIAHAIDPTAEISADELLDAADLAMYEAKRAAAGNGVRLGQRDRRGRPRRMPGGVVRD